MDKHNQYSNQKKGAAASTTTPDNKKLKNYSNDKSVHNQRLNTTQKTRGKFVRALLPNTFEYYKSQNIDLKGNGAWRDAICPFHNDTNPSMRVQTDKGAYRCMVCGAHGGDLLAFHQHRHELNFIDACKQLGAWVEVK